MSAVFLVVYGCWQVERWGGLQHKALIGDLAYIPLNLGAAAAAWGASRRCRSDVRLRDCWRLLSLALLVYLLGDLAQAYSEVVAHTRPFPSLADVGYLCFYPLVLAALLRYPSRRRTARDRWTLLLDGAMVTVAGAVPIWYLTLAPTIAAGGQGATAMAVSVAYPLGDMVLLVGLATLVFRAVPSASRTALQLAGVGLFGFVVTDLAYGWVALHRGYSGGDRVDIGWMVSLAFFALAGAAQGPRRAVPAEDEPTAPDRRRVSWLPYCGLATTLAFVLVVEHHDDMTIRAIHVLALTLAALVSVRQVIVQAELLVTHRQLRASQAERAVLLDRTLVTAEEERVRLAAELHDGPVQRLTALGYLLERAARRTRRGDAAAALEMIEAAVSDLGAEIDGLRRLMSDLRPPALDQSGLETRSATSWRRSCAGPTSGPSWSATSAPHACRRRARRSCTGSPRRPC